MEVLCAVGSGSKSRPRATWTLRAGESGRAAQVDSPPAGGLHTVLQLVWSLSVPPSPPHLAPAALACERGAASALSASADRPASPPPGRGCSTLPRMASSAPGGPPMHGLHAHVARTDSKIADSASPPPGQLSGGAGGLVSGFGQPSGGATLDAHYAHADDGRTSQTGQGHAQQRRQSESAAADNAADDAEEHAREVIVVREKAKRGARAVSS